MNEAQPGTRKPIACNLTEPEQREQRQVEVADMLRAVEQVEELEDGYAFGFAPNDEVAAELLGFILSERKCCPFFTFELVFETGEGPVWLRLRGEEGVKEFVEEAFHPCY